MTPTTLTRAETRKPRPKEVSCIKEPITAARIRAWPHHQDEVRQFLREHMEVLVAATLTLAGRKGTRIVDDIREGIAQPGPLSRRTRQKLADLLAILGLENVHEEDSAEAARFAMIDPADPMVEEICLLTDGLRAALASAGLEPRREPAL